MGVAGRDSRHGGFSLSAEWCPQMSHRPPTPAARARLVWAVVWVVLFVSVVLLTVVVAQWVAS